MTNIFNKNFFLFLIIVFFGFLFRLWNINFDDLWFDEIISFWLSDPSRSFLDNLNLHYKTDVSPYTYHLILNLFFNIFGYTTEFGRIISSIFGCLSILTLSQLVRILGYNRSYNLCLYLIGFNIFLISYSQEMRLYSVLFFFSTLSLIYFIKNLKKQKNKNLFFFSLFTIITLLIHPFTINLIFAYSIYLFLIFLKKKILYKKLYLFICFIFLTTIMLYSIHFFKIYNSLNHDFQNFWIPQINYKFFTNFFFSHYFGSRLMGILFLVLLIFLIIKNFNIFYKLKKITIFLILIIITYIFAILFNYLIQPIMLPRYFIFLLAPIIILISILSYELKNKKIKKVIVIFLILTTFLNHFSELTFKQFYNIRFPTKPEYSNVLNYINNSKYKNFSIKIDSKSSNQDNIKFAILNYVDLINKKMGFNNKYNNFELINSLDFYWIICPLDFQKDCFSDFEINKFSIVEDINFNRINIKLVKKLNPIN